MSLTARATVGLALAAAAAYWATPVAIVVADRLRFYDRPAGYKGHGRPTPYLGGSAVMLAFVLPLLVAVGDYHRTVPLIAGVALLWAVGTLDDRRTVSPTARVMVELAVAGGLWALGLGWHVHLGPGVNLLLTCVWIVGVINAFNLFDNMDGAAGTMALVVSAAVAALGGIRGDAWLTAAAAALAGACLGFLPHNLARPSARIFLGDGGSMPLGFAVAALVMIGASGAVPEWQALLVGLLLVGLPALDTALVIVSRTRRGISILTGGRDHLTHRTRQRMRTPRAVAVVLGAVQAVLSAFALIAVQQGSEAIMVGVIVYLILAGTTIALLEAQERRLALALPERAPPSAAPDEPPDPSWPRGVPRPAQVMLGVLGLGAGMSAFFSGYYDSTVWVPIGLGVITVAAAGAIARPPRMGLPALLAIAGLAVLGGWTLLSGVWSESSSAATTDGNRVLVLAAVLAVALMLVRSERRSAWLVAALGAGTLAVALSVLARLIGHDPRALLEGSRLNSPLGYVNGEACALAIGMWPLIALAESRRIALAGLGAAGAVLLGCEIVLTQSRGAGLAVLVAAALTLALVPGGRRRAFLLLIVLGAIVISWHTLIGLYDAASVNRPLLHPAHVAARATILVSLLAGLAWSALVAVHRRAVARGRAAATRLRSLATAALLALVVAAVGVGAVKAGSIGHQLRVQYDAFVHLSEPSGDLSSPDLGRVFSGAGNRYDYWRVAVDAWTRHPVLGLGAGGFAPEWYVHRAVGEDVQQPHSLEIQALSETGLIGATLLLVFLAGAALGAWRMRGAARESLLTRTCMVAAVGGATAWLVQTSVDWIHLLPGVTAVALCLIAVLVRERRPLREGVVSGSASQPPGRPAVRTALAGHRGAVAATAVVVAALVATGASLGRQGLADLYRSRAQADLAANPTGALREADRSMRIDGDVVQTYYLRAAALARFNLASGAVQTLWQAIHREPENWVTWGLLGDLEVRRGDLNLALAYYRRAQALNPLDSTVASSLETTRAALVASAPGLRRPAGRSQALRVPSRECQGPRPSSGPCARPFWLSRRWPWPTTAFMSILARPPARSTRFP